MQDPAKRSDGQALPALPVAAGRQSQRLAQRHRAGDRRRADVALAEIGGGLAVLHALAEGGMAGGQCLAGLHHMSSRLGSALPQTVRINSWVRGLLRGPTTTICKPVAKYSKPLR